MPGTLPGRRIALGVAMAVVAVAVMASACGRGGAPAASGGGQAAPPGATSAAGGRVTWDYYIFVGPTHHIGRYAQEFAKAVQER
ncbi:MAG: hypothetical protein IRY95_09935, partial [Clostridia bacterium]|nr:hypothetical protein [Clostridia bacterium]